MNNGGVIRQKIPAHEKGGRFLSLFFFFFFIPMENLISSLSLIRSMEGRGWGDGKLLDEKIFSDGFSKSRRLMRLYLTLRYLRLEFYYLNFLYEFEKYFEIIFHGNIEDCCKYFLFLNTTINSNKIIL